MNYSRLLEGYQNGELELQESATKHVHALWTLYKDIFNLFMYHLLEDNL